jgi:hypothetical protein
LQSLQTNDTSDTSIALASFTYETTSFKKALDNREFVQWEDAIQKEYDSHILNNTWTLVECPDGARVIGNMWRFKIKRDGNGKVVKYKARLCARGDQQTTA